SNGNLPGINGLTPRSPGNSPNVNSTPRFTTISPSGGSTSNPRSTLSGSDWMRSPSTNLNPGWNRPQTSVPNNKLAYGAQSPTSPPNCYSHPRKNFPNPGMTRIPSTNFSNHMPTPIFQPLPRPNPPPPQMNHANFGSMPHSSGGGSFHPSGGGGGHSSPGHR